MRVDHDKLIRTLVLVRLLEEQIEQFCTDPHRLPVPWQHVVTAVEQYANCAIQVVKPTAGDLRHLNGTMVRWDDDFVAIVIRAGLSTDDENVTIVKEAMHPLIDTPGDRSADTDATIEKLFTSEFFGAGNGENDHVPVVQSEHLAMIAACALLVPSRIREKLKADIAAKKTTVAREAITLGVPEHVVEIAISDTVMEYTALAAKADIAA